MGLELAQIAPQIDALLQVIANLLPFLGTAAVTYFVARIELRRDREKAEAEIEIAREKAERKAQEIVNEQFAPLLKSHLEGQEKQRETAAAFDAFKVQSAEERGALNERIRVLNRQVQEERAAREQNSDRLKLLESQLETLQAEQKAVNERLTVVSVERDTTNTLLATKEQELQQVVDQMEALRKRQEELIAEVAALRKQLEARDQEVIALRAQLEGRDKGETHETTTNPTPDAGIDTPSSGARKYPGSNPDA